MQKYIPVILFVTALLAGLSYMNEGLFHYDAISLAQAVEKTFQTGKLQPAINGRYGSVILSSVTYIPFWLSGKNADLAVRLSGVVWYALSISFFYLFLLNFFSSAKIAAYSSMLLLSAPIYLSPNTFGKEHGMALAFFFLACYLLFKGKRFYAASAAALIFSLTIREAILVLFPFYFLILWMQHENTKTKLIYCAAPMLVFFLLIYLAYFSLIIEKTLFPVQTGTAYFLMSAKLMTKALGAIWKTTPLPVLGFAILGIIIGLQTKFRKITLFTIWLIVTFVIFSNNSTFVPRYLDATVAALCVLAGAGIAAIHKLKYAGIALSVILAVWALAIIHPTLAYRHSYSGPMHLGKFIENLTTQEDIIIAQDDASFINYYGNRTAVGIPIGNKTAAEQFIAGIQEKMRNGTNVYLTQTAFIYDPGETNQKLVTSEFKVEKRFVVETEASHIADIELLKYKHVISKLKLKNETKLN